MSRAVEIAYATIRRAIITGELRSGDTLQEAKLAEKIGVSRTPVREALTRLSTEGLVVLARYRRGYVAHFSSKDVEEIFRLRAVLEAHAAGRAATCFSVPVSKDWRRWKGRWRRSSSGSAGTPTWKASTSSTPNFTW